MKACAVPLLVAVLMLTGCIVVPAEPAYVGPPRVHVRPPAVYVVPGGGYYSHRRDHNPYWGRGYRRDY